MKKIKLVLLVALLIFVIFDKSFGVGMITEPIVVKDVLRGGQINKTITVFNPEKNKVVYSFGANGQIEGWVTFFQTNDLKTEITETIVPAKEYYDIIAKITVPKTTANGKYVGEIFVKQEPKAVEGEKTNTVSISQMVGRKVEITVSDKEIIGLNTTLIPFNYDFKPGSAVKVKIRYENKGNISLKPDLQIKITNDKEQKTVFNAIFPYAEDLEAVVPGETKSIPDFEWQTAGQPNGPFTFEAQTLNDGKVIDTDTFGFNIGNAMSFNGLASINSAGSNNLIILITAICLVIVGLAVVLKIKSKKKISAATPTKS